MPRTPASPTVALICFLDWNKFSCHFTLPLYKKIFVYLFKLTEFILFVVVNIATKEYKSYQIRAASTEI